MQSGLPIGDNRSSAADDAREHELGELVDRFYTVIRSDPVLGPIFESHVSDWTRHLETMRRFWSAAMYQTGRYAGRPLDVHLAIPELKPEHFPRWLRLWEQAVDDAAQSDARDRLKVLASRMASTMQSRIRSRDIA